MAIPSINGNLQQFSLSTSPDLEMEGSPTQPLAPQNLEDPPTFSIYRRASSEPPYHMQSAQNTQAAERIAQVASVRLVAISSFHDSNTAKHNLIDDKAFSAQVKGIKQRLFQDMPNLARVNQEPLKLKPQFNPDSDKDFDLTDWPTS